MQIVKLQGFSGVNTAVDPKLLSPMSASRASNVRIEDGQLKPRYGYTILEAPQGGFSAIYGFGYLQGYTSATENEEYFTVETISGNTRFYSRSVTTGAATEITNSGASVNLGAASEWTWAVFDGDAYFINPQNTTQVYRHTIGTINSLEGMSVPSAPTVAPTYAPAELTRFDFTGIDPTAAGEVAVTGAATNTASSLSADGELVIRHTASTLGASSFEVDLNDGTWGVQDFTYKDSFYFLLHEKTSAFKIDVSTIKVEFRNNDGSPMTLTPTLQNATTVTAATASSPSTIDVRFRYEGKTRANFDNVRYFKVSYTVTTTTATASSNELTCDRPFIGGVFGMEVPIDRLPDPDGLEFAYSYYFSTLGLESELSPPTFVPNSVLRGQTHLNWPLGQALTITMTVSGDANVDNYRLYAKSATEDQWRRVVTQSDATPTYTYRLPYSDLVTGVVYTPYTPGPGQFTNVVAATAYRGSFVWFYGTGSQNIKFSRVGDAIRQQSDFDDPNDNTRGATFTLADNFGDAPRGGVQAGDSLMIAGNYGVYAQFGDFPAQMTPPRKVSGSVGVAGRYAFCRAKTDSGIPGMAYVSRDGQVYFASPGGFSGQETGDNYLLTDPVRDGAHSLTEWLLKGQPELSLTDFSTAQICYDDQQDALIVIMGKRGLILRRPGIDGQRNWEPVEYNTGSSTTTVRYLSGSTKRKVKFMLSSGEMDDLEYDSATNTFTEGLLRDGGRQMPTPYWRSKRFSGPLGRIKFAKVFREELQDAPLLRDYCTRRPYGVDIPIPANSLGVKPPLDAMGSWHEVEIRFQEADNAVEGIELEFQTTANRRDM